MFQNPNIDITKRIDNDRVLEKVYAPEVTATFKDNEELLCAIFSEKATCPGDTYPQLHKREFINLLSDAELLILPKQGKEEKKDPKAADKNANPADAAAAAAAVAAEQIIYTENEIWQSILPTGTFDSDYLDYFNFLEALVRVCNDRPWSEDEMEAPFTSRL